MLKNLMNQEQIEIINQSLEICDCFEEPSIRFMLTKQKTAKPKTIFSVYDRKTNLNYIVIDNVDSFTILETTEIKYTKTDMKIYGSRIENYVLNLITAGYAIHYMDISFQALLWDFIDEFIIEVLEKERGVYSYLLFCKETGISYETIIYNTNYMIPTDIMEYFYRIEYKNYGVIQYQPIGNEYLLLGTNFDEEETRYYAVLLLDSKHEILEKKHHSQLESAIYDFNNRFYDLKIKEHKECEDHIKHCIEEHINFLKERNEEVQ